MADVDTALTANSDALASRSQQLQQARITGSKPSILKASEMVASLKRVADDLLGRKNVLSHRLARAADACSRGPDSDQTPQGLIGMQFSMRERCASESENELVRVCLPRCTFACIAVAS